MHSRNCLEKEFPANLRSKTATLRDDGSGKQPKCPTEGLHWARVLQSSGAVPSLSNPQSRGFESEGLSRVPGECRIAQPIEPHGLHRSYQETGSHKRAEAALGQLTGQPNPAPWLDAAGRPGRLFQQGTRAVIKLRRNGC